MAGRSVVGDLLEAIIDFSTRTWSLQEGCRQRGLPRDLCRLCVCASRGDSRFTLLETKAFDEGTDCETKTTTIGLDLRLTESASEFFGVDKIHQN